MREVTGKRWMDHGEDKPFTDAGISTAIGFETYAMILLELETDWGLMVIMS